jgi:[acyl-carrier-protein] S-malonyltransferase
MGRDVALKYPSADRVFKAASEALEFDIEELIFNGEEEKLVITENTQPALLTVCTALTQPLLEKGIKADITAGLSIGEYAAHVLANTFSFNDAVKIVKLRGKYMQEEVPVGVGGMAAILGLDSAMVEDVCRRVTDDGGGMTVEPANYNCPGQLVISGDIKAVEKACELCKESGAKRAVMLAVSAPFHCGLLKGAGAKLEVALAGAVFNKMQIPVISNVTAEIISDSGVVTRSLVEQVSSPVKWEQCVRAMLEYGVETFVEIGPGKTLAGFIKKIDKEVTVINVSDVESLENAFAYFEGK